MLIPLVLVVESEGILKLTQRANRITMIDEIYEVIALLYNPHHLK